MNWRQYLPALFACVSFAGAAHASGGHANALYRFGVGANVLGVGGAVVSLASDPASILVNPAGAAYAGRGSFAASHTALAMDRTINLIAMARQLDPRAGFSIAWINSGVQDLIGYDLSGNPTGALQNGDNTIVATFGSRFGPIAGGVSAKWHRIGLNNQHSSGWAFNVGLLASPLPGLSVGASVRDLLGTTVWTTETASGQLRSEDSFPVTLAAGAAYEIERLRTTLAANLEHVDGEGDYLHLGASVGIYEYIRLRAGYRWIGLAQPSRKAALAAGVSVFTGFGDHRIQLDYSVLNESLGVAHSLGMIYAL